MSEIDISHIRMRREIYDAILHLLDAGAPIEDVVDLSYALLAFIESRNRVDLRDVATALELAAGEGIVAMLREDKEMRLVEQQERWLGYIRQRREGETEDERVARLKRFGIDP